jgi:hypothetical protein
MYISNTNIIKSKKLECNKIIFDYLISQNIPLLSRQGEIYIFSFTDIVEELIKNIPKKLEKEGYKII